MRKWSAPGAAVLLAIIANLNVLGNGFVSDDHVFLENPWLHSARFLPELITHSVFVGSGTATPYYRPLWGVLGMLCYSVFGMQAWGYHLVSILLHAACTLLVFLITAELADRNVALWSALLFAVLPVHSELIAWVSGHGDLAFTALVLLSLLLYVRKRPWLALAAFFPAVFFKETAVMGVTLFLAWELVVRREEPVTPSAPLFTTLPCFLAPVILYAAMRSQAMGGLALASVYAGEDTLPPATMAYTWFALFGNYLRSLVYPLPLSIYHPFRPVAALTDWRLAAGAAATILFVALAWTLWKRSARMGFAMFWIFAPLVPALVFNRTGGNVFGERYLYLSSAASCGLMAVAITAWSKWTVGLPWRKTLGVMFMVWCAWITVTRNRDFRDDATLWQSALAIDPDSSVARSNLADAYLHQNRPDLAVPLYSVMVREQPLDFDRHLTYGMVLASVGRREEARQSFEQAAHIAPKASGPWYNLGILSEGAGDAQAAERFYRKAIELEPSSTAARENLGVLMMEQHRPDEAATQFREAHSFVNLGKVLELSKRLSDAENAYRQAVAQDQNNAEAWYLLARVLKSSGRAAEAQQCLDKMRQVLPGSKWQPPGSAR
jgi:protein O-mannosyl-transferase